MEIYKVSAFTHDNEGGNKAGVVLSEKMLEDNKMLEIAKELNYSETAFLVKKNDDFRIRFFSPLEEISFCGHATIASTSIVQEKYNYDKFNFIINDGIVKVQAKKYKNTYFASLLSVKTYTEDLNDKYIQDILYEFNFSNEDLDTRFPIKVSFAGARHMIIFVKNKKTLQNMSYNFDNIKKLKALQNLTTISILHNKNDDIFHSRNAFAFGGVYEDPATGAAAGALGEYLRHIKYKEKGEFTIIQGEDMNIPCKLYVQFTNIKNSSIKVSGYTKKLI